MAAHTLPRAPPADPHKSLRTRAGYGSEAELELHMVDGVFWPRAQGNAVEAHAKAMAACVSAAIAAADQGQPIQYQRRPPKWVFNEVETEIGRRPTRRDLLEILDAASREGKVRYLKGNSKRMAGYYPWDEVRAAEMAAEATRSGSVSFSPFGLAASPQK